MSETCRGHLWDKIIIKLFASSWYIFLTDIRLLVVVFLWECAKKVVLMWEIRLSQWYWFRFTSSGKELLTYRRSLLSPNSGSDSPIAKPRGILSQSTSVFDYSTAWRIISWTVESSVVSYVYPLVLIFQISAFCSRCVFSCFVQFSHSTFSLCNKDSDVLCEGGTKMYVF